jgi:aminopeptidase-like protein
VCDFAEHNLHVLNYSEPIDRLVSRDELAAHVHTLPDQPHWIPYRTSYYRRDWGFCMAHDTWRTLPEGEYHARIDASLAPGALSLAELVLPGRTDREVVFSTHVCHPSMCNDNLSGIAVQTLLFEWLAGIDREYTYRAVFVPGTIGAITWLWLHRERLPGPVAAGLVLAGLGDEGGFTLKHSRRGDTATERATRAAARAAGVELAERPFSPYGYDERQYCSPGFDLPVGRLSRTPFGEYPEYHTSADDLGFVSGQRLAEAVSLCQDVVRALEADRRWRSTMPWGEPQLGRRGLYDDAGGPGSAEDRRMAMLWMLNLSDGGWSLLEIAERAGLPFPVLEQAARRLADAGLLVAHEPHEEADEH